MKFGQVVLPEEIDFTLPPDHPDTTRVLEKYAFAKAISAPPSVFVGCAKWNKADLKGFYP
ncbi:MAG: hypothetical protein ACJARZ_002001, partial [Dokdonia sp.]